MIVHIKPELEAIVADDLKSGGYESVDAYIENLIEARHTEHLSLLENRDEIEAQLEEGWAEAERGELIDGDTARAEFLARRQEWLRQNTPTRD